MSHGFLSNRYVNSIGMEFIPIPAGEFKMGSVSGAGRDTDEKPQHGVAISNPFSLGRYAVTQAQWEAVMGRNPSRFKGPDRPVEQVNWREAQLFIKRLNAKEGHRRYRLPTEAEWEFAARAGSSAAYSFGDDAALLGEYAWYGENTTDRARPVGHRPVGQKRPNAWGLHDMHGNVWEWVQDLYSQYFYAASPGRDPQGPTLGEFRVLRGGSWSSGARYCRSACRDCERPGMRSERIGFRLALSLGE